MSKISWCDESVGFWTGCAKVSEGCRNCYAEAMAQRFYAKKHGSLWGPMASRLIHPGASNRMRRLNRKAKKEGRRISVFINPMADFFEVPGSITVALEVSDVRNRALELFHKLPQLDILILTKRPENIRWIMDGRAVPSNVCVGVSVEDTKTVARIQELLYTPQVFSRHFLSLEPLIGPVSIPDEWIEKLSAVIVGGESGNGAREMKEEWVRNIRDQCERLKASFHLKQWSANYCEPIKRLGDHKAPVLDGVVHWVDGLPWAVDQLRVTN